MKKKNDSFTEAPAQHNCAKHGLSWSEVLKAYRKFPVSTGNLPPWGGILRPYRKLDAKGGLRGALKPASTQRKLTGKTRRGA
ncbi:MAG: hypothetical protein ABIF01_03525 [Candidatus Micrarchaeota archaeon]